MAGEEGIPPAAEAPLLSFVIETKAEALGYLRNNSNGRNNCNDRSNSRSKSWRHDSAVKLEKEVR